MSETIRWSVQVRVDRGPAVSVAPAVTVDAYDKLELSVPAGATRTAAVQPGTAAQVELLLVTSSRYHDADLSYELGGETILLDGPQLFTGAGMLSLFGADPTSMEVTNGLDEDVTVTVLVARSAA
jgi:hypothetical protein